MWSIFRKPACPIDASQQKWVDQRFHWLEEQLGKDNPCKANVILPTPEFFPDVYRGRPDDVQPMFDRIATYMNVDSKRFKLFFYTGADQLTKLGSGHSSSSGSAGVYVSENGANGQAVTCARIGIEMTQLADPTRLVATLAHEIGHEILLGQNRVSQDEADHEPLTDLLTVFLGLGIFNGNATISDRGWSNGNWAGWETKRLGYLSQRMYGYALAKFAYVRGEVKPAWMKHVRPDVRAPLKQGLRFLISNSGLTS